MLPAVLVIIIQNSPDKVGEGDIAIFLGERFSQVNVVVSDDFVLIGRD